jgi:hypothetical protein
LSCSKVSCLVVGAIIAALAISTAGDSAAAAANAGGVGSTASSTTSPSNPATPGGPILVPNTNPYYTVLVKGNQPRVAYGAIVNGCVIAAHASGTNAHLVGAVRRSSALAQREPSLVGPESESVPTAPTSRLVSGAEVFTRSDR